MLDTLTENQLDQLQQHLIVPLAVADILRHDLEVEPDMQYGLHMALSEIDPDSALLAIALCARDLAEKYIVAAPIAAALQIEANDIILEYGPTWLHHYKNGPMPPETFEAVLENAPEDLEALADLVDALNADLDNSSYSATALADLLSIQARAHMEIASYILSEIEFEKRVKSGSKGEGKSKAGMPSLPASELLDMDKYTNSNIIVFPGNTRH